MKAVKTILFVENDPVSLTMYQNRLQREGFYIETAQDGLTALRTLSQSTPDLVVLDLMLPRFSGGEVFKVMRADRRLVNIPVVIFSNAAMTEWPQDLNAGTTRCLPKSDSTFPMLLQTIQEMLAAAPANEATIAAANPPSPKPAENRNGGIDPAVFNPPAGPIPGASPSAAPASKGRTDFLQNSLAEIPKLRELCLAYIKAPAAETSQQYLATLQQRVQFFHTSANQNGCPRIALLTNVFGTLLSEILAKPSWATTSALQTMAQAVDCLRLLLNSGELNTTQPSTKARILAVDDDPVCNHVIVTTLRRANFDPITIENPVAGLELLKNGQFDLVLLDVNMPEMTGFQLCEKLRRIPHCKTIPVVFVTAFNNFDNRKQSVLSGGNDFITKPISPLELALKVTIHMLKSQLQRASAPPVETAPDIPDAPKEELPAAPTIPIVASISARNGASESPKPEPQPAASSGPPDLLIPSTPPPSAPHITQAEQDQHEMADTVSASALEATTESQTADATQSETPATTPATPELAPANTSEAEFQLAATIPAPQLDPALAASLAPAGAPAASAESMAIAPEVQNSLTTAPIEPASEEAIPAASIPRDMFQPAPTDTALPASSLVSSTQSGTDDAESLMAAALEEMAMDAVASTAPQSSSPTSDSTVETPAKPAAGDTPAVASTTSEQNEAAVQPETPPQIAAVETPIAPAEATSVSASAPQTAATAETSAQPDDSQSARPLEPAPTETSAALPATPVADTIAFEAERQSTSTASATGSESIKSDYAGAVQSDLFPMPPSVAPLQTSAPVATESKTPAQTVISPSAFDRTCIEVAKLMFGENGATEMNLRLVRAALERANVHSMVNGPTDLSC